MGYLVQKRIQKGWFCSSSSSSRRRRRRRRRRRIKFSTLSSMIPCNLRIFYRIKGKGVKERRSR